MKYPLVDSKVMKHLFNNPARRFLRRGPWAGLGLLLATARPGGAQTLPPAWPDQPLAVTGCAPAQAVAGTRVVVRGQGFVGVSSVRFNGLEAEAFDIDSPTQLTALVPALASSGPVSVSTAAGTACTTQPLEVPPEVLVQGAQLVRGTYARLVVGPGGVATLAAPVRVLGTLVVQPGGHLDLGSYVVTGEGFQLADGATLSLSHPAGLAAAGATGGVQTATRSFSSEASYVYRPAQPGSQTGAGLPTRVRGLSVLSPAHSSARLTLTCGVAVGQVLHLGGTLATGGHSLLLLTSPTSGPALLLGLGKL
ncbi:MAG: hypothetical protein EOO59_14175, partial [Hymenobacter sp.]